MSKRIFVIVMAAVALIIFMQPNVFAKQAIKLGLGDPIDSDQGALAKRFKVLVEGYTGGDVEVQLFPGGALGSEQEMVQNARLGTLDVALVAINNITPFSPTVGVLTLPYLIQNMDDAVKVTTGKLGKRWSDATIKEAGVRVLGWTYSNFRVLTNSKRPVRNIADLKGLKIRVPKNAIMIATYKSWGLSPVPMAWDETFTALQQKVIDGQDNPYIVNNTMKFYEVQKYVTNVHYLFSLQPLVIGEKTFQKMSPDMQAMLTRAGLEAQQYELLFQMQEADKAKQNLVKNGMEVLDLEDEDVWIDKATTAVWPDFYDSIGGKDKLDDVLKELGRAN
ncbi:MAG: TRAP transporter substrate-binding protein [Desulfobacteraceae bacterium]|nr:TRAP transporter substrate-binding protein [Desulfobacteraceae bacterium]